MTAVRTLPGYRVVDAARVRRPRRGCATTSRPSSARPSAARSACRSGSTGGRRTSPSFGGRRAGHGRRARSRRTSPTAAQVAWVVRAGRGGARRERPSCRARSTPDGAWTPTGPARSSPARQHAAVSRDQPGRVGRRHGGAGHLPRLRPASARPELDLAVEVPGERRRCARRAGRRRAARRRRRDRAGDRDVRRAAAGRRAAGAGNPGPAVADLGGSCSRGGAEPAVDAARAARGAIAAQARGRGDRARLRARTSPSCSTPATRTSVVADARRRRPPAPRTGSSWSRRPRRRRPASPTWRDAACRPAVADPAQQRAVAAYVPVAARPRTSTGAASTATRRPTRSGTSAA